MDAARPTRDDRQLRGRALRIREMRRVQEPRPGELAREQRHALVFGERGVVVRHAGLREQLGHDRLVHVGVLAQVEHREMESEDVDGAHAAARDGPRRAAPRRAPRASARSSRDRRQAPPASRTAASVAVRRARRHVAGERARRGREPRVDADQRLPIRLVGAMRVVVVRRRGEREQFAASAARAASTARARRRARGSRRDSARTRRAACARDRVLERCRQRRTDCRRGRRRSTSPAAGTAAARSARRPDGANRACEPRLERQVELAAPRRGTCSDSRRGRCRSRPSRSACDSRIIAVCHSTSTCRWRPDSNSRASSGVSSTAVAPLQQPDDLALAIENALALDLGRMRGEHRAHLRVGEPRAISAAAPTPCVGEAIERVGEAAALRRRAGERVRAPAAVLVHVLGEVREMREVAERAHDVQRLADRQLVQQCRELGLHRRRCVAGPRGGSGSPSGVWLRRAESGVTASARAARRPAAARAAACRRAAAGPCPAMRFIMACASAAPMLARPHPIERMRDAQPPTPPDHSVSCGVARALRDRPWRAPTPPPRRGGCGCSG